MSELDGLDDRALLEEFLAGSHDAFGTLFRRHRDRLWAVALRTCGNPADAEDALQEALVSAYQRAGSFRGDAAVTTWLHRVVVNACLDRLRATKVRRTEALPDDPHELADRDRGALLSGPGTEDPADAAVRADRRRRVLAALAQLPPEQRAALVLVDMEGYPVAEAAAILDCAEGTVKSRCSRGRARLAVLLEVLHSDAGDAAHPEPRNPPPAPVVPTTRAPRAPPGTPAR